MPMRFPARFTEYSWSSPLKKSDRILQVQSVEMASYMQSNKLLQLYIVTVNSNSHSHILLLSTATVTMKLKVIIANVQDKQKVANKKFNKKTNWLFLWSWTVAIESIKKPSICKNFSNICTRANSILGIFLNHSSNWIHVWHAHIESRFLFMMIACICGVLWNAPCSIVSTAASDISSRINFGVYYNSLFALQVIAMWSIYTDDAQGTTQLMLNRLKMSISSVHRIEMTMASIIHKGSDGLRNEHFTAFNSKNIGLITQVWICDVH